MQFTGCLTSSENQETGGPFSDKDQQGNEKTDNVAQEDYSRVLGAY